MDQSNQVNQQVPQPSNQVKQPAPQPSITSNDYNIVGGLMGLQEKQFKLTGFFITLCICSVGVFVIILAEAKVRLEEYEDFKKNIKQSFENYKEHIYQKNKDHESLKESVEKLEETLDTVKNKCFNFSYESQTRDKENVHRIERIENWVFQINGKPIQLPKKAPNDNVEAIDE